MAKRLLILGAGGHARAVADLAAECGWTVAGFTDRAGGRERPEVLGDDSQIADLVRSGKVEAAIVGVGNTALGRRVELFEILREADTVIPSLVHPRAMVSRSCTVGAGAVVFAGVVLGAGVKVGENAVLYSNAVAEHDCRIAAHAYLSPGVILCGAVTVESTAFLGAGAVVLPGVTIGPHVKVGAGVVVRTDMRSAGGRES
jgi:sugar O-acyltransferase (sialic acid O-acetyltransferase NeuD family)